MKKKIEVRSNTLGTLTAIYSGDFVTVESFRVPMFPENEVSIDFHRSVLENEDWLHPGAESLLKNFFDLTALHREQLSREVYGSCKEFFELTGFDEDVVQMFEQVEQPNEWHLATIRLGKLINLENVNQVWEFVTARSLWIEKDEDDKNEFIIAAHLRCAWDEEHGLNMIFKKGWQIPKISVED